MDKPEDMVRELIMQAARVAYALETVAVRQGTARVAPCRRCGCTLHGGGLDGACPACGTEDAR